MVKKPPPAFTIAVLKPEIATGSYNFHVDRIEAEESKAAPPPTAEAGEEVAAEVPPVVLSPISGVPVEDAVFFLPNGQILPQLLDRIKQAGFRIQDQRMVQFTRATCRSFVRHEQDKFATKKDFEDYLTNWCRGPSLALLLELPSDQDDAVLKLQQLVGDADPSTARKMALAVAMTPANWPLRALCGLNLIQNAIHCSATVTCAYRERYQLFPPQVPVLERAAIVLLPKLLQEWTDASKALRAKLQYEGIVIVEGTRRHLTIEDASKLLHLHPNTTYEDRQAAHVVLQSALDAGTPEVLIVEGLDLRFKLRTIVLGPLSMDEARLSFPDTLRGQQPCSFATVDQARTQDGQVTGLESGILMTMDTQEMQSVWPDEDQRMEQTFAIIKPGPASDPMAVQAIQERIRAFGFVIEKQKRLRLSRAQAALFYAEHTGKAFFERLMAFMTSGEIIAMQLARKHAIVMWRGLMGPTNALMAKQTQPQSLRARFGTDGTRNATHGSDSRASAMRELGFFFGKSASTLEMPTDPLAQVATRPLPAPYANNLHALLAEGLGDLFTAKDWTEDPLGACQWLGNWLLTRSAACQEAAVQTAREETRKKSTSMPKKATEAPTTNLNQHQTIALAFDDDVPEFTRTAVVGILKKRIECRYLILDVAQEVAQEVATSVVNQLRLGGKRRTLLLNYPIRSAAFCEAYQAQATPLNRGIDLVVNIGVAASSTTPTPLHAVAEQWMKRGQWLHYPLSLRQSVHEEDLASLLETVFDPVVMAVYARGNHSQPLLWDHVAAQFGFTVLCFDQILQTKVAQEKNGVHAEYYRSKATIPSQMVMELVREAIVAFPTANSATKHCRQKFLLMGLPWDSLPPETFEQNVCKLSRVIEVTSPAAQKQPPPQQPSSSWLSHFGKQGIVVSMPATKADFTSSPQLRAVFEPTVGLVLDSALDKPEAMGHVQAVANEQSFVCIDARALLAQSAQQLMTLLQQRMLLQSPHGKEKFLVINFPMHKETLDMFQAEICLPMFVIVRPASEQDSSATQSKQHHVETAHACLRDLPPSCRVLVIPSNTVTCIATLRGLLYGKSIALLYGDTTPLSTASLRAKMAMPTTILDVRNVHPAAASAASWSATWLQLVIARTFSTRCVVLGAPESEHFVHTFQHLVGTAVDHLVVFKQLPLQPPPRSRKEDEDYYSDDEEELERQRQWKQQQALRPALEQLVQYCHKQHICLRVIKYLDWQSKVLDTLVASLRPSLIGVIGNAYTFYQQALANVRHRHPKVGYIQERTWTTAEEDVKYPNSDHVDPQLVPRSLSAPRIRQQLVLHEIQTKISQSTQSIYFLDGFPRLLTDDLGAQAPAPYIAEQIASIEQQLGVMPLLINFTASMEILDERRPDHVTRNALEDAQDRLEAQTQELLAFFHQHKQRKVVHVTCERELVDAEEVLESTLVHLNINSH